MKMKRKVDYNPLAIALLVVVSILVGIGFAKVFPNEVSYIKDNTDSSKVSRNIYIPGEQEAVIRVPAIDENGKGVSTDLIVKVEEGTGRTLVDINTLLFWVDTQNSIRMAKLVSENITGLNLSNYDITYRIDAEASLIGGESAGAALTIATIAALENKKLKDDVMITGTINHDGSIGPIGGVLEKAQAAKDIKANTFLVPLLQGNEIIYNEKKHCEKFGLMEWCNIERIPKRVNIGIETGINVYEVGSIKEALDYFYV